jgi:hypothetical protein
MAYHLNLSKYKMNISSAETKSMAMCGIQIWVQRVRTEQVSDFKYLGYLISGYRSDLEDK